MKIISILMLLSVLSSCMKEGKIVDTEGIHSDIIGTWQLISVKTIEGSDTTIDDFTNGIKGIKAFNDSHFSFFQHDLNKGIDSAAMFVAGGGTYFLKGNTYTENLEYCNFRVYEDNTFEFYITLNNDTLIQKGIEEIPEAGIDKYILETYIRTDK